MSEVTALAPEALSGVRKAQEALRQQADKLTAIGDPSGPGVAGLAAAMEATCRLVVDATLTQQKLAEEGRKPWTREEMRLLVTQMRDSLMHLWTGFNRVAIVSASRVRCCSAACAQLAAIGSGALSLSSLASGLGRISAKITGTEAGYAGSRFGSGCPPLG